MAAGMAMALGYKANAEAFLQLFLWLQRSSQVPIDELLALAMGVSGFLTSHMLVVGKVLQSMSSTSHLGA